MGDLERYVKDEIGNPIQPLVEYVYYVVENIVPDKFDLKGIERDEEGRKLTVKNQYVPPTTNITIKKYWENDSAGQDELRPGSIEVELLRDKIVIDRQTITPGMLGNILTNNPWTFTFEDLPLTDENGYKYEYEVREFKIGDEEITNNSALDYKVSYENIYDEDGNLSEVNISNSYEGKTEVSVKKEWDDKDNQDGKRPSNVTIHLLADGNSTNKSLLLSEANDWQATFTGLDKYDESGRKIRYRVKEDLVHGYESNIYGDPSNGFTVHNTRTPETIEVSGKKIWDDSNNQDGLRPESITINLLANSEKVDSVKVTEESNWSWTFSDLAKYENGQEINYSFSEESIDNYSMSQDCCGNIVNSYTPGQTSVQVTKSWDDENNQDGKITKMARGQVQ